MIYRHCPRCGKKIAVGKETCDCAQQIKRARDRRYDSEKRNRKHAAFYASPEWIIVRDACRDACMGLDLYALYARGQLVPGRVAHHIIPLEDDWTKRLLTDNVIYVSESSHQEIHRIYAAGADEKKALQTALRDFQRRCARGELPLMDSQTPGGGQKSI